ncbi:MAG: O-antigen ligase family protein [Chloroflexi bacterium]|nr:O-antigen ligase family protein [Chloroflexota bacterium]
MLQQANMGSLRVAPPQDTTIPLTRIEHIVGVIGWVLLLWAWGTLLNSTPNIVDAGILAATAIPALWFFWKQPAYGLIALMFFASGFLEPAFVDIRLPVGGGLEMRDIILLVMVGIVTLQRLILKSLPIPWWPVGPLLIVFYLFVLFSLFNALFFENVASNWALNDARILSFYLIFFVVAWSITTREALFTLIVGSFVVADITAMIVLIQQRLGAYNYLIPSMNDTSWQIWEASGAVRVVPPGIVFMYFMNLISIGLIFFTSKSLTRTLFLIGHSVFLTTALLFTFTRSAWVASGIALAVMAVALMITFRAYLFQFFILATATLMLVVGGLGLFVSEPSVENDAVEGLGERFVTIFTLEDTIETNSLQWRLFENQEAAQAIRKQPLTGVGLGNSYRDITVFQGESLGRWTENDISYQRIDVFTRYVHTSYYAMAVKMGIPALIVFLLFCAAALINGFILYARLPNIAAKGLVLAVAVGMIGLLQWSLLHSHLVLASSTSVIGLMFGLSASIYNIYIVQPEERSLDEYANE